MMMSIFPNVLFQQLSNTWATRQVRPKSASEFELYWTFFGYADDDPALRAMRLKQANMIGPGGLVSMEDGESGVSIQRAVAALGDGHSVIEMGGTGADFRLNRTMSSPRCPYAASGSTIANSWAMCPRARPPSWPAERARTR